jgi:hypothetical protein
MDRPYAAENDAPGQHLRGFVAQVTDDNLARSLGQHWTVGVALAHLAFWDRLWLAKFEEWERTGVVKMAPADTEGNPAAMNDAMLPWWRSISPVQVRHKLVAAAEAIDSCAARLPEPIITAILAVRLRTLIRAVHRREHLDEIERALTR